MIVEVDGQRFDVPDDATPEEIDALTASAPARQGMGDVRVAEAKDQAQANERERIVSTGRNLPVSMLTGDPETDRRLAEIAWKGGQTKEITPQDADRALALAAGLGASAIPGVAPAMASSGLLTLGTTEQKTLPGAIGEALGSAAATGALVKGPEVLAKTAGPLFRRAANYVGQKAITGNTGTISVSKPLAAKDIQEAYTSGGVQPFGTVGGIAKRLSATRKEVGGRFGKLIDEITAAGIQPPQAPAVAKALLDEAASVPRAGSQIPQTFGRTAEELLSDSEKMALDWNKWLGIKRGLQAEARVAYRQLGKLSPTHEAQAAVANRVKTALEHAVESQAGLAPEAAAAYKPLNARLERLISASDAANKAAARASKRTLFGGLIPAIAGGAGLSAGLGAPGALALGIGTHLAQTRGPSTVGWTAQQLANLMEKTPSLPRGVPAMAGSQVGSEVSPQIKALIEAILGRRQVGLTPALAEDQNQ